MRQESLTPGLPDNYYEVQPPPIPHAETMYGKNNTGLTDIDITRQYITEMARHPLLTREQEIELAKVMKIGLKASELLEAGNHGGDRSVNNLIEEYYQIRPPDDAGYNTISTAEHLVQKGNLAKQTFIESNLRYVINIAKKYEASNMPLLDLIQEGNLGLVKAVERFDESRGFKFSTYATWWIKQSILRAIADSNRVIRLPVYKVDEIIRMSSFQREMEQDLGREPRPEELAAQMSTPLETVDKLLADQRTEPVSLSTPVYTNNKGESVLADFIPDSAERSPEKVAITALMSENLQQMLNILDSRERKIIEYRMGLADGEPRTLEEIGKIVGLTRERIRQLEGKAISKLRHPSFTHKLKEYRDQR